MSNTCNEPYKKATALRGPIYHFCRQYKNTALFPKYYLYLLAAELVLVSNHCFIVLNFLYIFILSCLKKLLIIDWYFLDYFVIFIWTFFRMLYIFIDNNIFFILYMQHFVSNEFTMVFPLANIFGSWMKKKTERKRERERGGNDMWL